MNNQKEANTTCRQGNLDKQRKKEKGILKILCAHSKEREKKEKLSNRIHKVVTNGKELTCDREENQLLEMTSDKETGKKTHYKGTHP